MSTTTATIKGQVTIPLWVREKLHIRQGTKLTVEEKNGRIIMEPLPDDLLTAGRGMLKSKGRALKLLLAEREAEAER